MEKEKKEAGMQKKNFKDGIRLSPLGMGAMRLPQTEEGFAKPIDEPRAQEIIDYCIQHGVNYFDTAYIYHGGQSETFLGKALKKYPRESYFVADKMKAPRGKPSSVCSASEPLVLRPLRHLPHIPVSLACERGIPIFFLSSLYIISVKLICPSISVPLYIFLYSFP